MKTDSPICSDAEVLGGTWVFAGSRVPVLSLFDHLQLGDSIADFLEGFPSVKREQVLRVPDRLVTLKPGLETVLHP